jgi:hypothetical protein
LQRNMISKQCYFFLWPLSELVPSASEWERKRQL